MGETFPYENRLKIDDGIFENRIEQKWLTTKQAAHFLGLSENALRILVFRKKIRAFKLGRRLRFKVADLNRVLFKIGECNGD